MPDELPKIEQRAAIEADIEKLSREIGRLREMPEHTKSSNEELLKKSIQSMSQTKSSTGTVQVDPNSPLPAYAQNSNPSAKLEIEQLIELAFNDGIEKAVSAAKKSNPFILDAFHDALTEKLYPELKKRGLAE